MGNKLLYSGIPTLLAAASGALLLRRLGRRWGATDDEVHRPMPADELIPHPMVETTHAITIQAAAAEVWPWLVQMGMDRGGWYSDPEWWDGLFEKVLWFFLSRTEKTGYSIRSEPSAGRIIGLLPKQFIFLRQGLFFLQEFLNHSGLERCSITVFSSCLQYILFQPLSVFIIVPETTKKPEQAMLCMARSSYVILLKKNYGHEGERVSKAHH